MKKLLYLFLAISIISCGGDDDGGALNNPFSVNYFFEIEIGGVTHKIEGSFDNNAFSTPFGQNQCVSSLGSGNQSIQLKMSDVTDENYVSGHPIGLNLYIPNPELGNNFGSIGFDIASLGTGSFLYEYAEQNNITFLGNDFVENTPVSYSDAIQNDLLGNVSNIVLSDLGTGPTYENQNFYYGQNIQGTYQGILYFKDRDAYGGDAMFDIPVPLRIAFSAVRFN